MVFCFNCYCYHYIIDIYSNNIIYFLLFIQIICLNEICQHKRAVVKTFKLL